MTIEKVSVEKATKPRKKLINFKVDESLHSWAKHYAAVNGTDLTKILVGHLNKLKNDEEGISRFLEIARSEFKGKIVISRDENGYLSLEQEAA